MMDTYCSGCDSSLEIDWFCPSCNCSGTLNKMVDTLSVRELDEKLEEKEKDSMHTEYGDNTGLNVEELEDRLESKESEIADLDLVYNHVLRLKNIYRKRSSEKGRKLEAKDKEIKSLKTTLASSDKALSLALERLEAMEKAGVKIAKSFQALCSEVMQHGIGCKEYRSSEFRHRIIDQFDNATEDFKKLKAGE